MLPRGTVVKQETPRHHALSMPTLEESLRSGDPGLLLYGITPPKAQNTAEKNSQITQTRIERIRDLPIDGVVVYDLQDETSRIPQERPFPFIETLPADRYGDEDLSPLPFPRIVYQCVNKYDQPSLRSFLSRRPSRLTVFAGAPSRNDTRGTSLADAYTLAREYPDTLLGGIAIAERHGGAHDEASRLVHKMDQGCSFFISQCVYDTNGFRNMLSDYYYLCKDSGRPMVPIIITLTPCGSVKTLEFLKWLGISIPRWIENDLAHSIDTLNHSIELCTGILEDIARFCGTKGIPLGCNVESVAVRRDEVLASLELVQRASRILIDAGLRRKDGLSVS